MQDLLTMALGGISLVAAMFLAILGFYISLKVSGVDTRIMALETEIIKDKDELAGMRIISSIIFRFVNESYALSDIQRRQIEDIIYALNEHLDANSRIDSSVFVRSTKPNLGNLPRLVLYTKLISPRTADITETLDDIFCRFPDFDSLNFFEALAPIVGESNQPILEKNIRKLRQMLVPLDSRLWTG